MEVISEVSVMGLVINKELCQAIWGIIIKNFRHKYSFIVSEWKEEFPGEVVGSLRPETGELTLKM